MTWTSADAEAAERRTIRLVRGCYELYVTDPKPPWDELTPEQQQAYRQRFGCELL